MAGLAALGGATWDMAAHTTTRDLAAAAGSWFMPPLPLDNRYPARSWRLHTHTFIGSSPGQLSLLPATATCLCLRYRPACLTLLHHALHTTFPTESKLAFWVHKLILSASICCLSFAHKRARTLLYTHRTLHCTHRHTACLPPPHTHALPRTLRRAATHTAYTLPATTTTPPHLLHTTLLLYA